MWRNSVSVTLLPIKQQALAADGVVDGAVGVGELAGDEGGDDGCVEAHAFKGRPTAFVEHVFLGDGVRRVGIDQHEVGPVAFADKSAFLNLEDAGGVVCGFFGDGFGRQEFEERNECALDHGHAGRRGAVGVLFFLPEMRRMVGADGVDPVVQQRLPERGAVGGGFDGGVAFDQCTEGFIVGVGKPEMVGAGFGGNFFAVHRALLEQFQLLRGGQMKDMDF